MEIKIQIAIPGNVFYLDMNEARELYNVLHTIFGTYTTPITIPYTPTYPTWTGINPFRYDAPATSANQNTQGTECCGGHNEINS